MPTPEQIERAARAHDAAVRDCLGFGLSWEQTPEAGRRELREAMRDALLAAAPTPEEHERGIEAAIRAYDDAMNGTPYDEEDVVRATIRAYLVTTGLRDE